MGAATRCVPGAYCHAHRLWRLIGRVVCCGVALLSGNALNMGNTTRGYAAGIKLSEVGKLGAVKGADNKTTCFYFLARTFFHSGRMDVRMLPLCVRVRRCSSRTFCRAATQPGQPVPQLAAGCKHQQASAGAVHQVVQGPDEHGAAAAGDCGEEQRPAVHHQYAAIPGAGTEDHERCSVCVRQIQHRVPRHRQVRVTCLQCACWVVGCAV